MEFALRVILGGMFGAVITAILWVAFFTMVVPWPGHEIFTMSVFILGGFVASFVSLKGMLW